MESKKSVGIYRIGFACFSFCVVDPKVYFYLGRKTELEIGSRASGVRCFRLSLRWQPTSSGLRWPTKFGFAVFHEIIRHRLFTKDLGVVEVSVTM